MDHREEAGGGGGAKEAIDTVKKLIRKKCYKDASQCIKMTMEVYSQEEEEEDLLKYGFGMLIISETLHYGDIIHPNCGGHFDLYSVLHLPPSSTEAEVKKRFDQLREEVVHLKNTRFPGATAALSKLIHANDILCHQSQRPKFDYMRKDRVLLDWPSSSNTRTTTTSSSFRESYLDWKPPVYRVDVTEHLKSPKKPKMDLLSPLHNCGGGGGGGAFVSKETEADPSGLSQAFRILKKKVFDEMPQNPLYTPLEKYTSKVRQGMILGLEMSFVKLCEEIRNSVDIESFLCGLDGFNEQISELKEMGFNVEKVSQRIDILRSITNEERASRGAAEKFEDEVRDREAKVIELQRYISELQAEIEESKDVIANRKSKIEILKKDSSDAVAEFVSTAKSKWV